MKSYSAETKRDLIILGAGLVGGATGAVTTANGENQAAHGLLWGGISATLGAVFANHFISDDSVQNESQMKHDLELFQKGKTVLEQEGSGAFTDRAGQKVFSGQKARWKIHATDRWVKDSDTQLHHVDHEVEITPVIPAAK